MQIFAAYMGNFCAGYFLSSEAMEATPSIVVSEESDDFSASSSADQTSSEEGWCLVWVSRGLVPTLG